MGLQVGCFYHESQNVGEAQKHHPYLQNSQLNLLWILDIDLVIAYGLLYIYHSVDAERLLNYLVQWKSDLSVHIRQYFHLLI